MSDSARQSPRGPSVTDKMKSLGSDHFIILATTIIVLLTPHPKNSILDTQYSTRLITSMESAIPPSTSSTPVSGALLPESPCSHSPEKRGSSCTKITSDGKRKRIHRPTNGDLI